MLLNYNQAQRVCENYQYLIGNQIMKGWKVFAHISAIVVCPFDEQNKYRFLELYKQCRNAKESLSFYDGRYYDILLIGETTLLSRDIISMELKKHLAEQGQSDEFDVLVTNESLIGSQT